MTDPTTAPTSKVTKGNWIFIVRELKYYYSEGAWRLRIYAGERRIVTFI
jgi:hypothetical protein